MFFQSLLGAALALAATANPIIKEQQPVLSDGLEGQQVDLIKEFVSSSFSVSMARLSDERADVLTRLHRLEKVHIIPTILDPFGKLKQHSQRTITSVQLN